MCSVINRGNCVETASKRLLSFFESASKRSWLCEQPPQSKNSKIGDGSIYTCKLLWSNSWSSIYSFPPSMAILRSGRSCLIVFVNPGFLVGLVLRTPAVLRTLLTEAVESCSPCRPSSPAIVAQVFSLLCWSLPTFASTASFTSSVRLVGRPLRGASSK